MGRVVGSEGKSGCNIDRWYDGEAKKASGKSYCLRRRAAVANNLQALGAARMRTANDRPDDDPEDPDDLTCSSDR
jgi:hypothetical protein